jgi:two-component system sensor histidine kinase CiaH
MSKNRLAQFINTPTAKLAATYLAIIMLMSVGFSIVFYSSSAQQLSRPAPTGVQLLPNTERGIRPFDQEIQQAIEERFTEAREALLFRLIWINLAVLLTGSIISYLLARKSLKPIEETMDAQTQFVSDASHELRTPLTVLQTTNEVALRKNKLTSKDARELITHNVEEVKKLKTLSDTLLGLLKISEGEVSLTEINLQDAVTESLQHIVTIAQQKNITIQDVVPEMNVNSNKALLARIVTILLDNAVKYSKEGRTIKINARKSDHKVYLDVIDCGIGIRASDLPHIFRRFYRADKSRAIRENFGYGLGLSIAEKTAHQLNAKIRVQSTIGQGSVFTVIIPT